MIFSCSPRLPHTMLMLDSFKTNENDGNTNDGKEIETTSSSLAHSVKQKSKKLLVIQIRKYNKINL